MPGRAFQPSRRLLGPDPAGGCRAGRLDDATVSSARYPADSGLSAIIIPPTPSPIRNVPIELDPPESKIYRDMLNPLLSPKVSEERLRPFIADLTTYFIDRVVESGRADLITDTMTPRRVRLQGNGFPGPRG